ncbi:MAG: tRNA (guanosine(37)-N1)-methyltransferase TrmD [Clostridiales bacterium]|jgi:tRNA (guanine37-N1)-methyltransferase|nr:tRNA (guanosine(37)-N1)-methyltransferase TrmD [Clostridiales bacterium]
MMVFYVLTLFPDMIRDALNYSILKRAAEDGLIEVHCVDIRDFSVGKHRQADDAPYGGGAGMVMTPGPVFCACEFARNALGADEPVICLTPRGRPYNQRKAEELSGRGGLILLCGHYEGIDQRALDAVGAEEISLGDFVLTGGEPAALAIIDSVSRLIPGVLGKVESFQNESFSDGLLEYPQYTRPAVFNGMRVPEELLSGRHKSIAKWRRRQSLLKTAETRPDLLAGADLNDDDLTFLREGKFFMKGIITVLGNDRVGIIAKVCTFLSNEGINILDISQTIIQGYFNMMMIVDVTNNVRGFDELAQNLKTLGDEIGVQIKLQHEDIFNSMHRI